jgi:hypothetical protein
MLFYTEDGSKRLLEKWITIYQTTRRDVAEDRILTVTAMRTCELKITAMFSHLVTSRSVYTSASSEKKNH